MVIKELKFHSLASGMSTRAQNTIFAKYWHSSESRFTSKMCSFSVRNHKIRSEQRFISIKVFRYDMSIWKMSKTNIWLRVSFYRHKKHNFASRTHLSCTAHGRETPTFTTFNKNPVKYIYIYISNLFLMSVILTAYYSNKYTLIALISVWSVMNLIFWKIKHLLFFDTSLITILIAIKNNSNILQLATT